VSAAASVADPLVERLDGEPTRGVVGHERMEAPAEPIDLDDVPGLDPLEPHPAQAYERAGTSGACPSLRDMMSLAAARRSGAIVFNEVAAEYDRHRPAYPDELIDQACEVAGVEPGDAVLEVGCGTGQLTRSLVDRGLRVVAVEPGRRLAALAERNLEGAGDVQFVNARFEGAHLPRSQFRAMFSAAAFHWIDPGVGWEKAARVLAPGGTLALIQYCGLQDEDDDQATLLAAFGRIAPELAADWPTYRDLPAMVAGAERRRENVSEVWSFIASQDVARADAERLFGDVRIACVPMVAEHTADELNGILRTISLYHRLSPDERNALESEHAALYQRLGRRIRSSMAAVLVTAQRSGPPA
jgi:SAM-dependent methyltransferase